MTHRQLSRREFVATAAGMAVISGPVARAQNIPSAADIINRIRQNLGLPWREASPDGLKAGDPAARVTGIALAVTPTLDVLRQAVRGRRNLLIVREPLFYAADEQPGARATDPVYLAKRTFIDEQHLLIYRLSEHWQNRRPQPDAAALAAALGWEGPVAGHDALFRVPPTPLSALVDDMRTRLAVRGGIRVVGGAALPVRTAFISTGTTSMPGVLTAIAGADVVIAGEPREWEVVPYLADAVTAGQPKGLVSLGRAVSQAPGLHAQAAWLRTFVPELAVDVITAEDPYWSPQA